MKILFWGCFFSIFYSYFGYPLLLLILSKIRKKKINVNEDYQPKVSFIIAAYNEEKDLPGKLDNTLALDYPKDKLQIIVASDCSDDRTDEIVLSYEDQGIILNRQKERSGKTSAQNDSVLRASGEIIVFSDATTHYHNDAVKKMVSYFSDPAIGCVAGNLIYTNPSGQTVGEGGGLYWRYEKWLRKYESDVCSLIGVSGCMYAVRKSAYSSIEQDLISDFVIATDIYKKGYRAVIALDAICEEETTSSSSDEFNMRIRVIIRSMRGLWARRDIFNPIVYGFYSIQLLSHKVIRYLVPIFMIGMMAGNLMLLEKRLYVLILIGQLLFYFASGIGYYYQETKGKKTLFFIPYYFLLVNIAVLFGIIRFVKGEKQVTWNPQRE